MIRLCLILNFHNVLNQMIEIAPLDKVNTREVITMGKN